MLKIKLKSLKLIGITFFLLINHFGLYAADGHNHISISEAEIVSIDEPLLNEKNGEMSFSISVDGRKFSFALVENRQLLGKQNFPIVDAKTGVDFKIYKGSIKDNPQSWARLVLRNGAITGVFFDGVSMMLLDRYKDVAENLAINALRDSIQGTLHDNTTVLIKLEDIEHNATCALHDQITLGSLSVHNLDQDFLNGLEQGQENVQRLIKINLFADTEFVDASDNAIFDMLSHLNVADGLFSEQLNVQIVLEQAIELEENGVFTSTDPETLVFALLNSDLANPGLRHLFTNKDLNGGTVGIAFIGTLCRQSSAGVTQRFGNLTSLIFSHELGHNFGSPHDNQNGSACAGIGSGFVMNPNINGAGPNFSTCSISQMIPVLEFATNAPNSCISEVIAAPEFLEVVSNPNLQGRVAQAYLYDADSTIDLNIDESFDFNLDIGPIGMTVSNEGFISWEPTGASLGINPVQITIQNQNYQTSHFFEIEVTSDFVNLQEAGLSTFGGRFQDASGGAFFNDNQLRVEIVGNSWKKFQFDYEITPLTMLEFDFKSSIEGEIHGIGFDTDQRLDRTRLFSIHGTQRWGIRDFRYTGNGQVQSFTIPIGEFLNGTFDRIVLANDNDRNVAGANGVFLNIKVYDRVVETNDPTEK